MRRVVAGTWPHTRPRGKRWLSLYAFGRSFGFPPHSAYKPGQRYPNQIGLSGSFFGRGWFLLLHTGRRARNG